MKPDYNKLFLRDYNYIDFIFCDNNIKYRAYPAMIYFQKFGAITYELGVNGTEKFDMYKDAAFEDAPLGMKTKEGHSVSKIAKPKIKLIIPLTNYCEIEIPGFISNFHLDDGFGVEGGWFDPLYHKKIVTEEQFYNMEALQISIDWEKYEELLNRNFPTSSPKKDIFNNIDLD